MRHHNSLSKQDLIGFESSHASRPGLPDRLMNNTHAHIPTHALHPGPVPRPTCCHRSSSEQEERKQPLSSTSFSSWKMLPLGYTSMAAPSSRPPMCSRSRHRRSSAALTRHCRRPHPAPTRRLPASPPPPPTTTEPTRRRRDAYRRPWPRRQPIGAVGSWCDVTRRAAGPIGAAGAMFTDVDGGESVGAPRPKRGETVDCNVEEHGRRLRRKRREEACH